MSKWVDRNLFLIFKLLHLGFSTTNSCLLVSLFNSLVVFLLRKLTNNTWWWLKYTVTLHFYLKGLYICTCTKVRNEKTLIDTTKIWGRPHMTSRNTVIIITTCAYSLQRASYLQKVKGWQISPVISFATVCFIIDAQSVKRRSKDGNDESHAHNWRPFACCISFTHK